MDPMNFPEREVEWFRLEDDDFWKDGSTMWFGTPSLIPVRGYWDDSLGKFCSPYGMPLGFTPTHWSGEKTPNGPTVNLGPNLVKQWKDLQVGYEGRILKLEARLEAEKAATTELKDRRSELRTELDAERATNHDLVEALQHRARGLGIRLEDAEKKLSEAISDASGQAAADAERAKQLMARLEAAQAALARANDRYEACAERFLETDNQLSAMQAARTQGAKRLCRLSNQLDDMTVVAADRLETINKLKAAGDDLAAHVPTGLYTRVSLGAWQEAKDAEQPAPG